MKLIKNSKFRSFPGIKVFFFLEKKTTDNLLCLMNVQIDSEMKSLIVNYEIKNLKEMLQGGINYVNLCHVHHHCKEYSQVLKLLINL